MPTQHVEPSSAELLQDVANSLLKSRKIVVVTGAGISTNSGIPDFRSENGLYALIQAQFDAASRPVHEEQPENQDQSCEENDDANVYNEGPSPKRRRTASATIKEEHDSGDELEVRVDAVHTETTIAAEPPLPSSAVEQTSITVESASIAISTPKRRPMGLSLEHLMTSPLSSPPPEDSDLPPSVFRSSRLASMAFPFSSSPLSSPPPVLFDPFCPSSPSDDGSSHQSSTSPSEVDDTPPSSVGSNPLIASQSSLSGKTSLPNMKGKDLFDASIWADPLRTSVFYTFATTLRQKIRDVKPTSSHHFISHLRDRGKLVRCYTQNIDQIEEKVGLSTTLHHGPGSRGRFSRRSTATSQLSKMVSEVSSISTDSQSSEDPPSSQPDSTVVKPAALDASLDKRETNGSDQASRPAKAELPKSGVECVFLHGSLEQLRCFLCGRVCSWDDDKREHETMSGQQPECPHCAGATAAREERGKRALGVGKLRPDIVLYGEEHPNAHLISPIVTHDLALCPDMLLILGTSLRVHGLKIMVREFAKAVHAKGGKVVFVNFTKPPESSWGDIIDYWVQWDCDAWVSDLQQRVPKLWQPPEAPKAKKKKEVGVCSEEGTSKVQITKPPPANPVALRDTRVTGAYHTLKIVDELHRITGEPPRSRRASVSSNKANTVPATNVTGQGQGDGLTLRKPRARGHRRSAPGALERPKKPTLSTLNPDHGRPQRAGHTESLPHATMMSPTEDIKLDPDATTSDVANSSILDSVKRNARTRKRKKIDGVEVEIPTVGSRRKATQVEMGHSDELTLAPIWTDCAQGSRQAARKLQVLEPKSPPPGPLASILPNMRSARAFGMHHSFFLHDPLVRHGPQRPVDCSSLKPCEKQISCEPLGGQADRDSRLRGPRQASNKGPLTMSSKGNQQRQNLEKLAMKETEPRLTPGSQDIHVARASQRLAQWGSSWNL